MSEWARACSEGTRGGTQSGLGHVLVFVHGGFPTHRASRQPAQGPSGSTCVSTRMPIESGPRPPTQPYRMPSQNGLPLSNAHFFCRTEGHRLSASVWSGLSCVSPGTFSHPWPRGQVLCCYTSHVCAHMCISHTEWRAPRGCEARPGSQAWPRAVTV